MNAIMWHMQVSMILLFVSLPLQLKTMEQIPLSLDNKIFVDSTGNYPSIILKQIDMHNLEQNDKQFLSDLAGNYEDLQKMFGTPNALIIKGIHLINPDLIFNLMHLSVVDKIALMPEGKKHLYNWVIKDTSVNQNIGYLCLSTYTDYMPQEYSDKLPIELGLILHPSYRNKGFTTHFAKPVLAWLQQFPLFINTIFCFNTLLTQKAVLGLAQKMQYKCVARRLYEVDFGLWKKSMPCDLFVIPMESGS